MFDKLQLTDICFIIFILQLTLKVILNLRQDEEEFYKTILHPSDVILARGVEGVDAMEVDKDDLEEAEALASFAEKDGVFDKALATEVEKVPFKRRKLVNTKLRDFTNPFGKQFKVNDPCEIDPLRPYDKDQFKNFLKWLDGKVDNKNLNDLRVGDGNVQ